MKRIVLRRTPLLLALALCACGGGSDGGDTVAFGGFVTGLVATTSDTTDPVPIDGQQFVFDEQPGAFDDVVQ